MAAPIINSDISKRTQQPMVFLSLAPTTSESYPTTQAPQRPAAPRRSSSQSSSDSVNRLRYLKLGPVHYGEHPDEHEEDFSEVAVDWKVSPFPDEWKEWGLGDQISMNLFPPLLPPLDPLSPELRTGSRGIIPHGQGDERQPGTAGFSLRPF
ncbi:hypothetical protein BX600DRAFT_506054 [Xylariales sp. PMI_506]|nr:hypothetical protein BX600DRAFT_506054 [Xylariales sp. PMI_506]